MSLNRVGALSACSSTGRMASASRAQAKPLPAPHRAARRGSRDAARARARRGRRRCAASISERATPACTRSMREEAVRTEKAPATLERRQKARSLPSSPKAAWARQARTRPEEDGEALPLEYRGEDREQRAGKEEGQFEGPGLAKRPRKRAAAK